MKKAQIKEIYPMLFAIIIIGTIVLIGFRSLGGLFEDKCTADFVKFRETITQDLREANDYGSVDSRSYTLPCGFSSICLVDHRTIRNENTIGTPFQPANAIPEEGSARTLISSSIEEGVEQNIFLSNNDITIPVAYSPELQTVAAEGILCQQGTGSTIQLTYRGVGRYTDVR